MNKDNATARMRVMFDPPLLIFFCCVLEESLHERFDPPG
jgi:hypothetical protein